jgi:hypothetical protein
MSSADVAEAADMSTERLVILSVERLKPHPALVRLGLLPPLVQLMALEKIGEFLFEKALLITQDNRTGRAAMKTFLKSRLTKDKRSCILGASYSVRWCSPKMAGCEVPSCLLVTVGTGQMTGICTRVTAMKTKFDFVSWACGLSSPAPQRRPL